MNNIFQWFYGKVQSYISIQKAIKQMEWIDLEVKGLDSKKTYEDLFKCKIINKNYIDKQKNIALLPIPSSYNDYLRGKAKQALRTNVNRATKQGYYCNYLNGIDFLDDIMDINRSSDQRGGREMEERYINREMVEQFLSTSPQMFGVFSKEGKLVAYIQLLRVNSMLITNKILGHADFLDDGIMYYMISQLVARILDEKQDITHIMYARYLVGRSHAGYTYFKERCGFNGYNIRFHIIKEG